MGLRVLVVDDTVVFRRAISDALACEPGIHVVGTAANGRLAITSIEALRPDLITLDIEMPEMNGLQVLEAITGSSLQTGVIVLSSLSTRGREMTLRALELGAFDFVPKPEGARGAETVSLLRSTLLPSIRAFERRHEIRTILQIASRSPAIKPIFTPGICPGPRCETLHPVPPLVLIAVSTGGPIALSRVLPGLPADLGAPVFIVQHMPAVFTESLALNLAAKCAIRVKQAADGDPALPNYAYIAPGGMQMKLSAGACNEIVIRITDDPPENNCRPSADYLFRSAAHHFPGRAVAVILTGMGNDGTAGLRMLKRRGCFAIAQDEASCVVFGMPKEAIAAGLVDTIQPLSNIATSIVSAVRGCRS